MDEPKNQPYEREDAARLLLARALRRARCRLFWEKLWPALAALATVVGLFLAFSWAGLWLALPPLARAIALFIFAAAIVAAALPMLIVRLPSVYDGLRRLDRSTGETHRPATTVADRIAANSHDPVAQALWQAHMERALRSARKFKAGWPSPRLSLRDPMAFRALVVILLVASFFAASGERTKRIAAAFDWRGVVAPANFRIDAWVTPPVYTGRPPVMLLGLRPGETAQPAPPVAVPVGSQLVIRATGKLGFEIAHHGEIEPAPAEARAPLPAGTEERRLLIKGNGSAAVHGILGSDLVWNFTAIPDRAPNIELIKDPERQARGALRLDYKMDDDYGVVEAKATFALKDAEPSKSQRSLFPAPDYALALPQARTKSGTAQTTHDVTEHPWAGADVMMTLTARDEAGNEGRSQAYELQLPQRIFVKPLARALIEQRRTLALDAESKPLVLTALDALSIAPERFIPESGVYLEDGNVSQAEQALRQAQEALRQALERGASDEEIKKLMEQLRAAMDKFLQALAEEMRKNPQQLSRPLDRNTRMLSQQDLKSMLDRLENLARSGNKDAARRLLEELQSMLENLQMARPGASGDDGDDDMMSALDELGDMIRKQQQLRDKTFRQGQDMRRERQRGQQQQPGQSDRQMGELRQDQQGLKDRLNKLLEQLRQRGMGQQQGQQGQQGEGNEMGQLGDAGEAMGQAEGQLGEGDADIAVDSQGRALDAMRKGARGLAQSMQQQGMGPGPNGRPGRGQARAQQDTDPLGRPMRGRDYGDDLTVKVPGEIDAQRARRILEELRRRFGESFRPQLELDYIERLLKDF